MRKPKTSRIGHLILSTVSGRNEKHEKGSITNLTLKNLNCDIYLREAMAFLYVPNPPPSPGAPANCAHMCVDHAGYTHFNIIVPFDNVWWQHLSRV